MTKIFASEGFYSKLQSPPPQGEVAVARRARFARDRFGIFIHFGPSAVPAGWWEGEMVHGLAEWMMFARRIPLETYKTFAAEFTLSGFDADQWVTTMRDAGARHMVITAKHHDGFAMFDSEVSAYNIVQATPYGRDMLAELADACTRHGLGLGVYYSHVIDWEHPHALGPQMNDWDFDREKADFSTYWNEKALPQIKELCTQYGDLVEFWFDMPSGLDAARADEAVSVVRRLQPNAAINSRIGPAKDYDFVSTPDNYPLGRTPARDWEMCATMNGSWGWKEGDDDWKPLSAHLYTLAHLTAANGSYLLNVGPQADGTFPGKAMETFQGLARYRRAIDSAINGAGPSPYRQTFPWGAITRRENSIYLHILDENLSSLSLPGPVFDVTSVYDTVTGEKLSEGGDTADILLPAPRTGEPARMVEVRFDTLPRSLPIPTQIPGQDLYLDFCNAKQQDLCTSWTFQIAEPGHYKVDLISRDSQGHSMMEWYGNGLTGSAALTGETPTPFTIDEGKKEYSPLYHFWPFHRHPVLEFEIREPGECTLLIDDLPITDDKWEKDKLNLVRAELAPLPGRNRDG